MSILCFGKMGVKFDQDWTTTFVTISDVSFHRPVHMSDSARQRPATAGPIGSPAWSSRQASSQDGFRFPPGLSINEKREMISKRRVAATEGMWRHERVARERGPARRRRIQYSGRVRAWRVGKKES